MDKREPHRVIRQLRDERERQRITQTDMAALLASEGINTTQGNISRWETGYVTPRLATLVTWAELLGLSIVATHNPEAQCQPST